MNMAFIKIYKGRGYIGKRPFIFYWIGQRALLRIWRLWIFKAVGKWGVKWQRKL